MHVLNLDDFEDKGERKKAVIIASSAIVVFLIISYFITFHIKPAIPVDLPPLNSDEVVEEFMIDNVELTSEEGGGGGGTPSKAPIDEPKEQTREYLTSSDSDFKVNSGKSQNQNSDNSNNASSTSTQSDNPFASGGTGGKEGAGKGKFGGVGDGDDDSDETGTGRGNKIRKMKGSKSFDLGKYEAGKESSSTGKIYLQLKVNADGKIIDVTCIRQKTTVLKVNVIEKVIEFVKKNNSYPKDPNVPLMLASEIIDVKY